jgi:ligand-binding sensor domain-containing protein
LWVGTTTGGLNRLREKKLKSYTEAEGFPTASIVPITQDRAGDVWMGATCGGLIRFQGGRFTIYKMKDGLPNDCVWALCADSDGSLWIGTWGEGLTHLKDGRFTTTPEQRFVGKGRKERQAADGALGRNRAGLNR